MKKRKKTVDKQISVWYSIKAVRETGRQPECGSIAQLGEHLPYKQGVTGSSPVGPITNLKMHIWRDSSVG